MLIQLLAMPHKTP